MTSRYRLWTTATCLLAVGICVDAMAQNSLEGALKGVTSPPAQPGEDTWTFIDDLKSPMMCCPWSDAAQRYLYEATHSIFSAVPHLGGLINIR